MSGQHTKEDCPFKEDIQELREIAQRNLHAIDKMQDGEWYSNQQLYEMIVEVDKNIKEFNQNLIKYNGLIEDRKEDREKIEQNEKKIQQLEQQKSKNKGQKEGASTLREKINWGISILLAIITILALTGVIG